MQEWYAFTSNEEYAGNETPFLNTADYSWITELESHYLTIRNELFRYLEIQNLLKPSPFGQEKGGFIPYLNESLSQNAIQWKFLPFWYWGKTYPENIKHFPNTTKLLRSIPNLSSAAFSLLEANTKIDPHFGDSNTYFRFHLGLKIPQQSFSCGIKVKGEIRHWEEGKIFGFYDAFEHEAWNDSSESRIILIFDVFRPEFLERKKQIETKIQKILFWQHLFQKTSLLKHLPRIFRRILTR